MPNSPPAFLERLLLLVLKTRDCGTISGDLMEEYREEQLPRLGPRGADFWYSRQVLSLASYRLFNGPLLGRFVGMLCMFTLAAGLWLFTMEYILNHAGHVQRSVVAFCIACQSLVTLLWLVRDAVALRLIVFLGSLAILWVGAAALWNVTSAGHFEGFAVIIAAALLSQSLATCAALCQKPHPKI